ncbi:MAG: tetratricopeptide repeat protein [Cellvibrionales bacterium]|nr:tetratricopeptide repeat protein [Cellvibrionales bacterium]
MAFFSRTVFLRTLLLSLFVISLNGLAKDSPKNYKEKQTKALRAPVYEALMEAQELQQAGKNKDAIKILDKLKKRSGKRALQAHEWVQLYNFYAYVYLGMENYDQAIKYFEKVLKEKELTLGLARQTKYTLAQLYISQGNPKKGVEVLEDWFDITDKFTPDAYVLLAQAYLQNKQMDNALAPLKKAFALAKEQGKPEKENWYSLLQYIYAEKKDYKKQRDALEVLVNRWPKKNYWLALVGVYSELEQEKEQLFAMKSAYIQGMLDREPYIVTLAQMLAAEGIPYEAAKVMEKGFKDKLVEESEKNLERVADYWRRSQEVKRAIPYQVRAAKMAASGEASLRLAGMYLTDMDETKAVDAIQQALKKGDLRNPLDAQMLLGQAAFQAKRFSEAKKAFAQVAKAASKDPKSDKSKRLAKTAKNWQHYIDNEIKRQAQLKKYLG